LITDFLELSDILKIVLLLITNLEKLPTIVVLAELDAAVPFSVYAYQFLLKQSHELSLDDFDFR
jgi:hypothetical protein